MSSFFLFNQGTSRGHREGRSGRCCRGCGGIGEPGTSVETDIVGIETRKRDILEKGSGVEEEILKIEIRKIKKRNSKELNIRKNELENPHTHKKRL
jgi:hypothetical protein